jgi:tetratricopeptide (TPR) repeat protein
VTTGGRAARGLLEECDDALTEAAFRTGDFARPQELLEAALRAALDEDDAGARASVLDRLGMLSHYRNISSLTAGLEVGAAEADAEEELFRQALRIHEAAGDAVGSAHSLFGIGLVFQVLRHDWASAMVYFSRALRIVDAPEAGADPHVRSEVHRHVGFYFLVEDANPGEALRHLEVSLALREVLGDPRRIPTALVALAEAELQIGDPRRAAELLERALAEALNAGLLPHWVEDAEETLERAKAALEAGA